MRRKQIPLSKGNALENIDLKDPFFNSQLITYIGNKRRLLPFLNNGFRYVRERLAKNKLIILDGFSGSGAAARLLKCYAKKLYVNDLENYCQTLSKCYLANKSEIDLDKVEEHINRLNGHKLSRGKPGFIELNYAPKDDDHIRPGERVFYTNRNAKIIDNIRRLIAAKIPDKYKAFCLAPLLVAASVHTNTSGVFKGFHKKRGIGHFGGSGENALSRIKKEIQLEVPMLSDRECEVHVLQNDINLLVKDPGMPEFDLVYYDPPYNQHPYGSNYFMLNLINDYKDADIQEGVSGIAKDWNKSLYNKRRAAEAALNDLLENTEAKYILLSYNNEGIIPVDRLRPILKKHGKLELMTQDYNTYRGSRNLRKRSIKVKEFLWILEKY
jgi:adenine-specific DNA-methyltransferase